NQPTRVGVFARRREIDELTTLCTRLEIELAERNVAREQQLAHLQALEARQAQSKDQLSGLHIESVELRKEREKLQLEVSRTERDTQAFAGDEQRNASQLQVVRDQIEAAAQETAAVVAEQETLAEEKTSVETLIADHAREFEALSA